MLMTFFPFVFSLLLVRKFSEYWAPSHHKSLIQRWMG